MKADEDIVDSYLKSLDLGEVVYEPDGTVPPDFLIDGRIAVEARRLNQSYETDGNSRGLEEDSIPLRQSLERLLEGFGPARDDRTWFVFCRLKRPMSACKALRPLVREQLEQFLLQPVDASRVSVDAGLEICFAAATTVGGRVFLLGGNTDMDSGGWVVSEILKNMPAYIAEKTEKVAPYRKKYSCW